MKYKCVIFDVAYTLVKHNDELETKMLSELLGIPYNIKFKKEVENFWRKSANYAKDVIINEEIYLRILDKMFLTIIKYNIEVKDSFFAMCNKGRVGLYNDAKQILEWLRKNKI